MKANYSYLSDGTKAAAFTSASAGKDYAGSFTYSRGDGGSKTLESVAFGGGRIRKSGSTYAVDYHISDHLGSVRAIVNASGTVVEQNDYYPFGNRHPNGLTQLAANRWRFSGKEEQDAAFGIAYSDFGARFYDRSAAWTAVDPMAEKYYSVSPYVYCKNNPVCRIEIDGQWDVTVHLYKERSEYGYGIAIVSDRHNNEIFRFTVRAEGVNGRDRFVSNSDTPLGTYDIPDDYPWISGGNRLSYGPYARLNMQGVSGEIAESGRSGIRIHGGRQEYRTTAGGYLAVDNPVLKMTQGCLRAFDTDMFRFKSLVDELQDKDEEEIPGNVFIIDDLKKARISINGNYVESEEVFLAPDEPINWNAVFLNLWNHAN